MNKFWGTVQFLNSHEALVEITNARTGEWAGTERLTVRHGRDLYEAAFTRAETKAALKGGSLDRFSIA